MKPFKSFLNKELETFISYREGLGYSVKHIRDPLLVFDRYIRQLPDPSFVWQPFFYLKFRNEIKLEPSTVNTVLYAVRCFFEYLKRRQDNFHNPLKDVPCLPLHAFIPFVFSPGQVDKLIDAVCNQVRHNKRFFLKDLSEYLVILLLSRCGMRINEPLRLKLKDYRSDERTLYIEKTKFKKDRLIPIPGAVAETIDNYLSVRAVLFEKDINPYLFIGGKQNRLSDQRIRSIFHGAVSHIGINRTRQIIGDTVFGKPTPHCLRHSFAVNTLKSAIARKQSAQNVLPVLAAYLGHVEYRHTMKYLKVLDAESGVNLLNFAGTQRNET